MPATVLGHEDTALTKTDVTQLSRNQHFSGKADNEYTYHVVVSTLKKNKTGKRRE